MLEAIEKLKSAATPGEVLHELELAAREMLAADGVEVTLRVGDHLSFAAVPGGSPVIQRPRSVVPLRDREGRTLAWLELHRKDAAVPWTADQFDRVQALAAVAALAIENCGFRQSEGRHDAARYAAITQHSRDVISAIGLDGRIRFTSPATRTMLGYEPEELVGRGLSEFIQTDDSPALRTPDGAVGQGASACKARRKDGSWVPVELSRHSVGDPVSGAEREIIAVMRDMSGQRLLEEQVGQLQKLESVGRLAGGLVHDFNNILTVINGYANLMAAELDESDSCFDAVAEIAAAGERAAALTDQLLTITRKRAPEARLLDLNATVRESARMVQRVLGENVALQLTLAGQLARAKADPGQIQQVLLSLAISARDALPQGGKLAIETANVTIADSAEARAGLPHADYVLLAADYGQAAVPVLANVAEIVAQWGGHVRDGQGTSVRIYLPRAADPDPDAPGVRVAPRAARGSETILVVEDQVEVRRLAVKVLTGYGYRVLDAGDADEALSMCERNSGPIHLLLTDVVMPGMSGAGLAERLKRQRAELKVLFMSGYANNALEQIASFDPCQDFLAKPFTADSLAVRVRAALGERRARANLLLVDDEASIRKLLRKILESAGYSVLEASNGREALARVRQRPVDLMLTDLVMPEKEGLETIRELRALHPAVRVIAMSGAFEGRYLKTAAMIGAAATVKKPIAPDQLLRLIETVLAGKS